MATKRTMRTIFAGVLTTGLLPTAFVVPATADVPRSCQHDVEATDTTVTACVDTGFDVITRPGYHGGSTEGNASTTVGVRDGYGGEVITKPGVRDPLSLGEESESRSVRVARTGADVHHSALGTDPDYYNVFGVARVPLYRYFTSTEDVTVYTAGHTTSCDFVQGGPEASTVPLPDCTSSLPIEELIDWGSVLDALGWSTSKVFR